MAHLGMEVPSLQGELTGFPHCCQPCSPEEKQMFLVPCTIDCFCNQGLLYFYSVVSPVNSLNFWYCEFLSFSILIKMLNERLARS